MGMRAVSASSGPERQRSVTACAPPPVPSLRPAEQWGRIIAATRCHARAAFPRLFSGCRPVDQLLVAQRLDWVEARGPEGGEEAK
jgi:hypothetical protein